MRQARTGEKSKRTPARDNPLKVLVPFSRVRPGSALRMSVTATYPAEHLPLTIFFNVDADEIPVGTPLGSLTITPPKP